MCLCACARRRESGPGPLASDRLVCQLIHHGYATCRFALRYADVLLLQRDGTEFGTEVEEAGVGLHAAAWRRPHSWAGWPTAHDADLLARRLDLAQRPRHERLKDRAAFVVEKVDLVDDHEADELGEGACAAALASRCPTSPG